VNVVKESIKRTLASRAGWRIAAPLRRRGVVVLMYHRINAGESHFPGIPLATFRRHMEWLRENCTPIWPEDVLSAAASADRGRPPVVVTFDDGYRDYHDHAYPVLRALGIPAAVFLSTHFMDRSGLLWTEQVEWAALHTRREAARLPGSEAPAQPLSTPEQRLAFARAAKAHLKSIPDQERRHLADALLAYLDAPDAEALHGRQMLSWDEVRATSGNTCFGGHSHTHPILSQMDRDAAEAEIRTCRERILAETGRVPRTFAYPNGRACDFNDTTRELLRRHGFELAFSTVEGINDGGTDALALRRQHPWDCGVGELAALMARA
jgi:peptidoglycan/xylan/chitin deacetylase (PgdA/CDA1 family)